MFSEKCYTATDKLQVCAYTDCCLISGLHNTEVLKAPAENIGFNVLTKCLDFRQTYWRQSTLVY